MTRLLSVPAFVRSGFVAVLVVGCGVRGTIESSLDANARADLVASHLLAPCCRNQSLVAHESPLAAELRSEIRTRISRGETSTHVERDLVARYGARLRSTPEGVGPPFVFVTTFVIVSLVAALAIVALVRRTSNTMSVVSHVVGDAYDRRLDDALAADDE